MLLKPQQPTKQYNVKRESLIDRVQATRGVPAGNFKETGITLNDYFKKGLHKIECKN